jgi:hypothetical protein
LYLRLYIIQNSIVFQYTQGDKPFKAYQQVMAERPLAAFQIILAIFAVEALGQFNQVIIHSLWPLFINLCSHIYYLHFPWIHLDNNTNNSFIPQVKEGQAPGDLGFDPLNLKPEDPETWEKVQVKMHINLWQLIRAFSFLFYWCDLSMIIYYISFSFVSWRMVV